MIILKIIFYRFLLVSFLFCKISHIYCKINLKKFAVSFTVYHIQIQISKRSKTLIRTPKNLLTKIQLQGLLF